MYKELITNQDQFQIVMPKTIVPSPTESDYDAGFIRRYFARKYNDRNAYVFEISEQTYSDYFNRRDPYWVLEDLKWRIKGPVEKTFNPDGSIKDIGVRESNKIALGRAVVNIPNIKLYLPNLLQFHRP